MYIAREKLAVHLLTIKERAMQKKSYIRVTLPKTELNVCLVLNVLMVEM